MTTAAAPPLHPDTQLAPRPAAAPLSLGIAPKTLEEGWRLAQMMAKSRLVPKEFQEHPEDVLVAIELGMEVGLAPMQALQSIAVINGRPSIWGDGFLALIMASPSYRDHDEYYEIDGQRTDTITAEDMKQPTTCGVCTFWRHGKATPVTRRFSIAQAHKAQLWGKAGPWTTYPDRMLLLRARSWAGRDTFPDVLRGIGSAEEALDAPPLIEDVTPTLQTPRRLSENAPAAAAPAIDVVPTSQETMAAVMEAGRTPTPPEPTPAAATAPVAPTPPLRVTDVKLLQNPSGTKWWEIALTDKSPYYTFSESLASAAAGAMLDRAPITALKEGPPHRRWKGMAEVTAIAFERAPGEEG